MYAYDGGMDSREFDVKGSLTEIECQSWFGAFRVPTDANVDTNCIPLVRIEEQISDIDLLVTMLNVP